MSFWWGRRVGAGSLTCGGEVAGEETAEHRAGCLSDGPGQLLLCLQQTVNSLDWVLKEMGETDIRASHSSQGRGSQRSCFSREQPQLRVTLCIKSSLDWGWEGSASRSPLIRTSQGVQVMGLQKVHHFLPNALSPFLLLRVFLTL